MDTPNLVDDASSLPKFSDVTPNSAGMSCPISSPLNKKKPQPRRRAVRQRAKPSYHDSDDSSDGGEDHSNGNKLLAAHNQRSVTSHPTNPASTTGIENKSRSETDPRLASPDKDDRDSKAIDLEPEEDQTPWSARSSGRPHVGTSPSGSHMASSPGKQVTITSCMRDTVPDIDKNHDHQTSARNRPLVNMSAELPSSESEPSKPVADDKQNANLFSLSAVPPSRGTSPPTAKTGSKAATNEQQAKQSLEQPRKKNGRQPAQRLRKPTTGQPKARVVAASVEPSVESFNGGLDNGGGIAVGPEVQEEGGVSHPTRPLKAELKVLRSPVNPDVAATQDLVLISSDSSSASEEDEDRGDGDFVPKSTISARTDVSQPKTRAATQAGKSKNGNKRSNVAKAKDPNSRQREVGKKAATDDFAAELKHKEHSKQPIKLATTHETHVGKTESRPKPQHQVKTATAPVIPASSEALQTSTTRQAMKPHAQRSKAQQRKDAMTTKSVASKPRQRNAGQMGKPGQHGQANVIDADGVQKTNIIAFDRESLKNNGRSQRLTTGLMLQSSDEDAASATKTEAILARNRKPTAFIQDMRRKNPFKPENKLQNPSGGLNSHYPTHQATRGDLHDVSVPVANQEHSAHMSGYEDSTREESILSPTFNDRTKHAGVAADDRGVDCVDDGNWMGIAAIPADNFETSVGVGVGNNNRIYYLSAMAGKDHPVPEEGNLFQENNPDPPAMGTHAFKRPRNQVEPLTKGEPLTKKPRYDSVDTASECQDEDLLNKLPASRTLPANSSDVFFDKDTRNLERAKETAFVRSCIRNGPEHCNEADTRAKELAQDWNVNQGPAVHCDGRAQPNQESDNVVREMLAAICRDNRPESYHDHTGKRSGCDGDGGVPKQPPSRSMADQRRAWKKETEPYGEGLGEVMHKAVNIILRGLKSKEDAVSDVIDDYGREGRRIVERITAKHAKERKQLVRQYEQYRTNYLQGCIEAHRRNKATSNDLKSVKLDQIMAKVGRDPAINRLKEVEKALVGSGQLTISALR